MSGARVVVLGCGNPGRGDDALGPLLLERVARWAEVHPEADVQLVGDYQLQIEHALDLEGRDLALFVDATVDGVEPCALEEVVPGRDASWTTHALSPGAVLHVFNLGRGEAPPPAVVLAVRGYAFELGAGLSEGAAANLEAGWAVIERWLEGCAVQRASG